MDGNQIIGAHNGERPHGIRLDTESRNAPSASPAFMVSGSATIQRSINCQGTNCPREPEAAAATFVGRGRRHLPARGK
jgi:hypothetical protein